MGVRNDKEWAEYDLHNQEMWVVDVELDGLEDRLNVAGTCGVSIHQKTISSTNHNLGT